MRLRKGAKRSRVSEQEANEVQDSTSSQENQKGTPKGDKSAQGALYGRTSARRWFTRKKATKISAANHPISYNAAAAAAAGILEEIHEHDRATEVESSEISGLEQAGSQTMSIETTDSQRKITKVAGESGRTLCENEEQSQMICHENDSVGSTADNEPEAGRDLPFVKSLEVWKTVDSMEIFKVMPQKPHFHPLVESKEIFREGLAIGYMLNFASLVQKTFELTVANPRNLFTTILDALPEFEILGFDVKAVRDRTSLLLSMKDRHGHLRHHSKEVILQANQCTDEITKINEDIDANQRMMRELQDRQADLLSRKKSKMSEFTALKVCADDTATAIKNLEADFESLAGSSW